MSDHVLLQAWAKTLHRHGGDRAVVQAADGLSCTFRELDARADAWLARAPAGLAGRAVVFALPNGIAWLETFLGLLRAGAVAVPLDPGEPASAQRAAAAGLRAGFWWDGTRLAPLPGARRFTTPGVCFLKLTSGSTGRPRPLVFTAGQLLADARQVTATMGITARDLNYALIPLGHSYGLGNLTLPLLGRGVPLVCGATPLPHAIAADFVRWRPTVFPSVPAIWRSLAASDVPPAQLASLRLAITAGAPLPVEVARDFAARFDRRLHGFYGSSETGGISYDPSGRDTLAGRVGKPMRGVRVMPLAGGRAEVSSAAVFTHGNRRKSGQHGAWVPPDQIEFTASGVLTIIGRRGTTVKIAGRRVHLTEVMQRLGRLAGVSDVWVGVSSGPHPELGAALATSRPIAGLRAELQADTASWRIPKRWLTFPALPLTARGKTDAATLRARLFGGAT
jgi:long-chain acyl-CoA synthetase